MLTGSPFSIFSSCFISFIVARMSLNMSPLLQWTLKKSQQLYITSMVLVIFAAEEKDNIISVNESSDQSIFTPLSGQLCTTSYRPVNPAHCSYTSTLAQIYILSNFAVLLQSCLCRYHQASLDHHYLTLGILNQTDTIQTKQINKPLNKFLVQLVASPQPLYIQLPQTQTNTQVNINIIS